MSELGFRLHRNTDRFVSRVQPLVAARSPRSCAARDM